MRVHVPNGLRGANAGLEAGASSPGRLDWGWPPRVAPTRSARLDPRAPPPRACANSPNCTSTGSDWHREHSELTRMPAATGNCSRQPAPESRSHVTLSPPPLRTSRPLFAITPHSFPVLLCSSQSSGHLVPCCSLSLSRREHSMLAPGLARSRTSRLNYGAPRWPPSTPETSLGGMTSRTALSRHRKLTARNPLSIPTLSRVERESRPSGSAELASL